jgi:integrase
VAALADPPKRQRYEAQYLTVDEARRFFKAVKSDRLEALYVVTTTLGLRKGEVCGLRWQDIDLENGELTVRYQLQRVGGKKQLVEPKTDRSRRTIALPPFVVTALRAHEVRQRADRKWAASKWQEHGLVFTTSIGTPLEQSNLSRAFHKLLDTAEIPRQRFHNLRHSAATLMLAQGVDAPAIMAVLGHSHISTTINLYAHIMPEVKRDAADRMEAMFGTGM